MIGALNNCDRMVLRIYGRQGQAVRLVALANDVSLLSEERDAVVGRMTGNFPQVFSHVTLETTVTAQILRNILTCGT